MNQLQSPADKIAISLSLLCAIHCLAAPILIALLPALASLPLESESMHLWMVVGVLPISLFSLTLGCKKHRKFQVAYIGSVGLIMMIFALLGEVIGFGEVVEKTLTLVGAALIALTHFWNYQLCRHQSNSCDCH